MIKLLKYFVTYFGDSYVLGYVQVGLYRRKAFTNQIGLVRFDTMYLTIVLLWIDRHCFYV